MAEDAPGRLLLRGATVLTGPDWVPVRRDVLLAGPVVEAVGAPGTFDTADAAVREMGGRLLVPGLVNAHTHAHSLPFRGVARAWTLEVSLLHGTWMSSARGTELAELCGLLAAAEQIASGATGAFDLTASTPLDPGTVAAVASGYARAGMRAVLAPMVADRSVHEAVPAIGACCGVPAPGALSAADVVERCAAAADAVAGLPLVDAAVAPTIPTHCSPGLTRGLHALAVERGLRVHLHLAESGVQATAGRQRFGRSLTAELAALGVLDERLTVAHAIWLEPGDVDLLAEAGVVAVTVPGSNLRLGSGVADTPALLGAGVRLAVGTDGANSADALDVLDAARLTALLPRVVARHPHEWPAVEEVLDAATVGGAAACGWDGVGRLAPGWAADLTALDLRAPGFRPANDLANQLLTAARAADVTDVMVAGRWVQRDRVLLGADLEHAVDRFTELVEELHATAAPARESATDDAARAARALDALRTPGHHLLPGGNR